VTTADAISVIVVIMRHMRFLFFSYDQQKPDKDLTEEVRGLFPRVAKKIEISVLGSPVGRGEFSSDGRPDSGENRRALAMSAINILRMKRTVWDSALRTSIASGVSSSEDILRMTSSESPLPLGSNSNRDFRRRSFSQL
jgi:hypothetical protein